MAEYYNKEFYEGQQDGSIRSALGVIPCLLRFIKPDSVLDIGCGVGTWLSVFKNNCKVTKILGVDGDYVDKKMLKIDQGEFRSYNLENVFVPDSKFDLAISLEVGEHIEDRYADNLVQSLTNAADFIMFSAALPGQDGTNHINEQFPEYWAAKFAKRGFICIDCIRKDIWNQPEIEMWYRQNILLYVKENVYENKYKTVLEGYKLKTDPEFLTRVHPELLNYFKGKFYQTKSLTGFLRFHLAPLKKLFSGSPQ